MALKFWCKKKYLAKCCENFLYSALHPEEVQLGKLFKNGPSKMFYFTWSILEYFIPVLSQGWIEFKKVGISAKLSFSNIGSHLSNSNGCKFFLESNSTDVIAFF